MLWTMDLPRPEDLIPALSRMPRNRAAMALEATIAAWVDLEIPANQNRHSILISFKLIQVGVSRYSVSEHPQSVGGTCDLRKLAARV